MFHKRCKLDLLDRGLAGQRRRVGTIPFAQCFMPRCARPGIIVVALTYVFMLADGALGLARAEGPSRARPSRLVSWTQTCAACQGRAVGSRVIPFARCPSG